MSDDTINNSIREFKVKDADRELRFVGTHIGQSSSKSRGSDRWIEFSLFRTSGSGKYVVSRVGKSRRFHMKHCRTVTRAGDLRPVPLATLHEEDSPCIECMPEGDDFLPDNALVYPETDRPWAGILDTAQAVVDHLTQTNEHGTEYLTHVARQLLVSAASNDPDIHDAYYVVEIS
jgi:hypothetical protein